MEQTSTRGSKKNLLSIEKNIIKWKKIPYRIYKKLLF